MSDMLRTYWTNFAKTGNPNGPGIPAWPAFGKTTPRMLHIASENTKAVPIVSEDGLRALDEYFAWRRTSAAPSQPSRSSRDANRSNRPRRVADRRRRGFGADGAHDTGSL